MDASTPRARLRALGAAPLAWVRARPRASLYLLSLALHLAAAPLFVHDWDGYVFIQSARDMLQGVTPYQTVEAQPPHIYVGDAVPVVNSWYAYPPLPLLMMMPFFGLFTLVSTAPWVERLAIKMPMVLGDLVLAFVAAELVRAILRERGDANADRAARRVETLLLFNPFLLFISAFWGMFDAWILALFLAAVLLVLKERPLLAGAAYAAACLVKPFPALLGIPLLVFAAHRLGWRRAAGFVGAGAAAGVAVCLPFFLTAPEGFLQLVVLNHAQRPPQGFTLVGAPLTFTWLNDILGFTIFPPGVRPETLSQVSFALILGSVLLLSTRVRSARDPVGLLRLGLVVMVTVLLASKVVNEQYFVLPVVLATVAGVLTGERAIRWTARAYTWGGLVSALWLGWHFVTFLPPDVALRVLPVDPLDAVPRIQQLLGWNGEESWVYPTLIGAAALVPAALLSFRLSLPELAHAGRDLLARIPRAPRLSAPAAFVVVALLLAIPVSAAVLGGQASPRQELPAPPLQREGPLVGTYYYLWWHNPAHDPGIEYGNWRKGVTQVPEEGYYTVSAGKIRNDFRLMRENGIDLVLFSYHDYDRPKLPAIARLAEETGLLVAPLVELSELYERSDHQPRDENGNAIGNSQGFALREGTRDAIVEFSAAALSETVRSPAAWRVDGKPVVVYFDSYFAFFDQVGEGRQRLIQKALEVSRQDVALGLADAPLDAALLKAHYPRSPEEFSGAGEYSGLWRRAYDLLYREFWNDVRARIEERHGPIYLVSGEMWDPDQGVNRGPGVAIGGYDPYDASYIYAPSFQWVFHKNDTYDANYARWRDNHAIKSQHDRGAGAPVIVSVAPAYDDRALRGAKGFAIPAEHNGTSTFQRMLADAKAQRPDVVLIATWNEFYEGTGIEPTREYGRRFLDETRAFSEELKADARADEPRRVLLVTNLRGAGFETRVQDPDWTYRLSVNLQLEAARLLGPLVDAVDWNGPALGSVDLSRYDLVVVEPGPGVAYDEAARAFPDRVAERLRAGADVLLLGSYVGRHWAHLAGWAEPGFVEGNVSLLLEGASHPVPPSDRVRVHLLPPGAEPYLWMANETGTWPAAWTLQVGGGTLAVTAFKPTSPATRPFEDPVLLRAALTPFREEAG